MLPTNTKKVGMQKNKELVEMLQLHGRIGFTLGALIGNRMAPEPHHIALPYLTRQALLDDLTTLQQTFMEWKKAIETENKEPQDEK